MSRDAALLFARICLVAVFPFSAVYKILKWPGIVDTLTNAGLPHPYELALIGTAAELILPLLVIVGLFTRFSMLGLIVYTIIATAIAHRFWEFPETQQFGQIISFLKNIGLIGGMALVISRGSGRYALRPSGRLTS
jgi:putative oxidoreductase